MKVTYFFATFSALLSTCAITSRARAEMINSTPSASPQVLQLLRANPQRGQVIRFDGSDMSKPDAKWQDWPGARLVYEQTYQQFGSHKLVMDNPEKAAFISRELWSRSGIKIKPNRTYLVSALIKTDFPRHPIEISLSMRFFGGDNSKSTADNRLAPRRLMGLPAKTEGPDGWQRLEWEVTVPSNTAIYEARASIFAGWGHLERPAEVRIADFSFYELPIKPLVPLKRGEGVTFPGGVGNFPLKVESAIAKNGRIIVQTTGAQYVFDTNKSTFTASQRIEFPRDLAKWESSLSFKGLRIDKHTDDVCVLSNDQLTIGIQADSMMMISPQKELEMTLTNLLGGDFNRYARGHLYSTDDFGGISVNPYIPLGTGRTARSNLLTAGLEFALYAEEEYNKLGKAAPNWQAQWETAPGELLAISVFPPRPFPWADSFKSGWRLMSESRPIADYEKKVPYVDTWLLWDMIPKTWGHSYSNQFNVLDDTKMREIVKTVHAKGEYVVPYISAYWTPSRDENVFIAGVKQFKDKYNIDGIYSDGLPSTDWLLAYKEMRLLRELFPQGILIVHDSFRQSGKPIAQLMPFLYSYATFNYMAEGVQTDQGIHWQYSRYLTTMFRKVNNLGVTKGDRWLDEKGEKMGERKALTDMIYNGRDHLGFSYPNYYKALDQLHELWKEKGHEPYFYDRYYLPKAQELTGYTIGRTAMPIVERQGNSVSLKSLSSGAVIYYTTDGSEPTENSRRYQSTFNVDSQSVVKAIAIAPDLEPSAVAVIQGE